MVFHSVDKDRHHIVGAFCGIANTLQNLSISDLSVRIGWALVKRDYPDLSERGLRLASANAVKVIPSCASSAECVLATHRWQWQLRSRVLRHDVEPAATDPISRRKWKS